MIALGSIIGVAYMVVQGKQDAGITFDQVNSLFLFILSSALWVERCSTFLKIRLIILTMPYNA